MAKIIQVTSSSVSIGMDDGSIRDYPSNVVNFMPSVGDEVQIYQNAERVIITKIEKAAQQPQVVINNSNNNVNTNVVGGAYYYPGRMKNKWVAVLLCFFLGIFGVHKFYEGKIGMGILYIFTGGLFGFGAIIDFFVLLFKPNPYYVK